MVRRHQSNRQRSTERDTWLTDLFEAIARARLSDVSRAAYDTNCLRRLRQCTQVSGDSAHRVCIMNNFGEDRFGILIAISDASTETGDVGGVRECLTANVVKVVMPALCNAARTLQITSADLPESVDIKILSDGRGKA
jgi:hypothetical protein